MRLVTYESQNKWRAGILAEDKVVDASAVIKAAGMNFGNNEVSNRAIIQFSRAEQSQLENVAQELAKSGETEVHYMREVLLGPPIPNPDKIICLGLNYKSHAEEAGFKAPEIPILFAKFRNTLIGPTSPIVLPKQSEEIDYESELAVVIGKRCKDVSEANSLEYAAGYMALHDVSARDLQFRSGQWLSGKSLDTFAPCGPVLVLNEIHDPQNLNIETRINGQVLQQSNTKHMIFSVAYSIAYISSLMTLESGDIIATGTPEGVGFKRTPPIFLKQGDIVEVEVEKIGTLRNPVVRNQ